MRKIYTVFNNKTGVVLFILFSILCIAGLEHSRVDTCRTGTNTATSLQITQDSYMVSGMQYVHSAFALVAPGWEPGNIFSIKFADAASDVFFGVTERYTVRVDMMTAPELFDLKQGTFEYKI